MRMLHTYAHGSRSLRHMAKPWSNSHRKDARIIAYIRRTSDISELPLGDEDYVNPGRAMTAEEVTVASRDQLYRRLHYMAKGGLGDPPTETEIRNINSELARRNRANHEANTSN